MKKGIIFILLFIFNLSFAHKDHIDIYKKKLVEIRMVSSFEYGEFNKLNVYGEHANEVVEFNKFKDSITVNFRYFINKQSGNEVMIEYNKFKNYSRLTIDIQSNELSIIELSKIIDFAIKNKGVLKKHLVDKFYFDEETGKYYGKHEIINPLTLENFLIKENSFINQLDLKVEVFKNEIFSCFWKNNEYKYYQKDKIEPIYTIKDYEMYSNKITDLGLIIFPNQNEFFFINNVGKISKNHELKCNNDVFMYCTTYENIILLQSYRNGAYYYSPGYDKLLKQVN